MITWLVARLLRCRDCGGDGWPREAHSPACCRLWRNGGEITGSGDAWHKAHGWTREESAAGRLLPRQGETVLEFHERGGRFDS
jgi:hypothetical protein